MLGGEGGLMDGMGLIIMLCLSCLISSAIYLVVWLFFPAFMKTKHG